MRRLCAGMEGARFCPERGTLTWRVCAEVPCSSPVYTLAQAARVLAARAQCGEPWARATRGLELHGLAPCLLVESAKHLHQLAAWERAYAVRFALAPVLRAVRGGEEHMDEQVERAYAWSLVYVRLEREAHVRGLQERESPATR